MARRSARACSAEGGGRDSRVRYDSPSEGVDVVGDREDLIQLAELVASGRGELETATGGRGDSGVVYLNGVAVEDGEGNISITVDDRRCLTIRGDQRARTVLAENLRD